MTMPGEVATLAERQGFVLYVSGGYEETSRGMNPDVKATVTYQGATTEEEAEQAILTMGRLHAALLEHARSNVMEAHKRSGG